MNDTSDKEVRVKCALFVDFDNIYLGLKKIDSGAAELFASEPNRWLRWIEQGMPTEDDGHGPLEKRAVLIRRCYLNPRAFGKYRPYFTRSAFSVIDCPPVTAQGKNSADIYMVMDVLDSLEHKTRFDEFILLSCDSDFAPVLLRLRAHDRRTVVFAIGPAAEAYKASCDRVITEDALVEALEAGHPTARRVVHEAADTERPKPRAAEVASELLQEIIAEVERLIAAAQSPVLLSTAAQAVRRALGPKVLRSRWAGAGTFQKLLAALQSPSFGLKLSPPPAYLFDPQRHPQAGPPTAVASSSKTPPDSALPVEAPAEAAPVDDELPIELAAFARRINQVTSAPVLSPAKYALVFAQLEDYLKTNHYHITNTSKALRDKCLEVGQSVSRRNILTILDGIRYSGYRFQPEGGDQAAAMKRSFRDSIQSVCNDAQLELTDDERRMLDDWILGDAVAMPPAIKSTGEVDWLSPVELPKQSEPEAPSPEPEAKPATRARRGPTRAVAKADTAPEGASAEPAAKPGVRRGRAAAKSTPTEPPKPAKPPSRTRRTRSS